MTSLETIFLERPDGERIAYRRIEGSSKSTLLWCGGLHSDMTGTKAEALADWAKANDHNYVRFDYFGHGESSGKFRDGTVSRWRDDALAVIGEVAIGPLVLVGSSLGGWIATLVALAKPERVKGIVYIAPAPDFTEELMWKDFSLEIQNTLQTEGVYRRPSEYEDEAYEITMNLIEDGRKNLVLGGPIDIRCPVRVLQGLADPDVPWAHAMKLIDRLTSEDVVGTFVKHADHRISDEPNIARLISLVEELSGKAEG